MSCSSCSSTSQQACSPFDVCSKLFMCVKAQRGVINLENSDRVRHLFRYEVRIENTSSETVHQFVPRLNFRCTFIRETQDALNGTLIETSGLLSDPSHGTNVLLPVYTSTSDGALVNPAWNGGLPSTVGGTDGNDHLMHDKRSLPPGEIQFTVCVAIDVDPVARPYDGIVVSQGIFSITGQTPHCQLVHRALATPSECLPAEGADLLP